MICEIQQAKLVTESRCKASMWQDRAFRLACASYNITSLGQQTAHSRILYPIDFEVALNVAIHTAGEDKVQRV